jgi:hypothetical protein
VGLALCLFNLLTYSGSDRGGCAVDTSDIRKREGGSAHVNHGGGALLGRLRSHSQGRVELK